jgi:hypothetical protein
VGKRNAEAYGKSNSAEGSACTRKTHKMIAEKGGWH